MVEKVEQIAQKEAEILRLQALNEELREELVRAVDSGLGQGSGVGASAEESIRVSGDVAAARSQSAGSGDSESTEVDEQAVQSSGAKQKMQSSCRRCTSA